MTPRRATLRRRLFALAVAGALPLAILAGTGLYLHFEEQRELAQHRALEVTRALATAVDAELDRTVASLDVLAAAWQRRRDLAQFDELARMALRAQPYWNAVTLADAAGRQLADTRYARGAPLPSIVEPASFAQAVRGKKVVIGRLVKGPRGTWAFAVRVPIVEDGRVTHVVTAAVEPDGIRQIVDRQRVPESWVISVFDAAGVRVARSRSDQRYIGTRPAAELRALMESAANEAMGITRTLEGDKVFTAFVRLPSRGWTVAMGLPVSAVSRDAIRSGGVYGAAVAFSILVGLLAAFLVARRIDRDFGRLRDAADALGAGREVAPGQSRIEEIHDVAEALVAASRQRRTIEAQREELLAREQAARGEAEAASRAKDQFLAMLAHELRNPLAALSNAAHLLAPGGGASQAPERVREVILRQVTHLARLTDDLLDAARALLGKIELRRRPVDLARIAVQTLETLAATGRTAGHAVASELREAWVQGDEVRLEQVASNLVVNAVKYTPRGGHIRVRTGREGGQAVLVVEDDGIGMSRELAARAFDLFVQGERSLERMEGGLGIGLTLVKRLVELHGGSVTLESEGENRGTRFTVRLPAIEAPAAGGAAPVPEAVAGRAIAIVEDNDDARETLREMLAMRGHRVSAAANGPEGLRAILQDLPDAALVDLGLPGMDGYELARRVRATGVRVLLVALSGYGSEEDRARALAAGFDAHFTKPLDVAALDALLQARDGPARPPG